MIPSRTQRTAFRILITLSLVPMMIFWPLHALITGVWRAFRYAYLEPFIVWDEFKEAFRRGWL